MVVSKREDARRYHEDVKIGVGIIGSGRQANVFVPACKANPHAEIVGLAETKEGVAELFADRHDMDVPIFSDYRELLRCRSGRIQVQPHPRMFQRPVSIRYGLTVGSLGDTPIDSEFMLLGKNTQR